MPSNSSTRTSQQTNQTKTKIMNIQKILDELPSLLTSLSEYHAKISAPVEPILNASSNNDDHEISITINTVQTSSNNVGDNNINNEKKTAKSDQKSENGRQDSKIHGSRGNRALKSIQALNIFVNNKNNGKNIKIAKAKVDENNNSNSNSHNSNSNSHSEHCSQKDSQIKKLESNFKQIGDALRTLWNFQEDELGKEIDSHLRRLKEILDSLPSDPAQLVTDLQDINKKITKLKRQIPSLRKPPNSAASQNNSQSKDSRENQNEIDDDLSILSWSGESLVCSSVYEEIKGVFHELDQNEKACLLCFAVFPEDAEVKKRLLTYWWVGEDRVEQSTGEETAENIAGRRLKKFVQKGLIEPVHRKLQIKGIDHHDKSYRMHPLVRSVLIKLANDNTNTSLRATLVKAKEQSQNDQDPHADHLYKQYDPEMTNLEGMEVKTIFSVDETFPDLKLDSSMKMKTSKAGEWSSKMKSNLKVLHLGKWQNSADYHIEVESTRFLEGLKNMKNLKFLSLQGISRINELPDSISKMTNLKILDLKECHTLEVLPKGISHLKQLTHLDVSGCYLLDYMPKGISCLINLQVLKGFVISDHKKQSGNLCTLEGLEGMKNLRKLSINISRKEEFPTQRELESLQKLKKLRKLTLAWGGESNRNGIKTTSAKKPAATLMPALSKRLTFKKNIDAGNADDADQQCMKLPENLEKLDLQCYPEAEVPTWMVQDQERHENGVENKTNGYKNLNHLKKLYLRGGGLGDLRQYKWSGVETLRLKFISEMRMNWEQLQVSFPELRLLEKVDCPRVTFCPCDENGVWHKH